MRARGTRQHTDRVVVLCCVLMALFGHARGFVVVGVGGGVSEKVKVCLSRAYVFLRSTRCKAALHVEKVRLAVTSLNAALLASAWPCSPKYKSFCFIMRFTCGTGYCGQGWLSLTPRDEHC